FIPLGPPVLPDVRQASVVFLFKILRRKRHVFARVLRLCTPPSGQVFAVEQRCESRRGIGGTSRIRRADESGRSKKRGDIRSHGFMAKAVLGFPQSERISFPP